MPLSNQIGCSVLLRLPPNSQLESLRKLFGSKYSYSLLTVSAIALGACGGGGGSSGGATTVTTTKTPTPITTNPKIPTMPILGMADIGVENTGNAVVVGATLTASVIDSEGTPTGVTYEWFRDGSRISDETGRSYDLVNGDANSNVKVVVSYSVSGTQKTAEHTETVGSILDVASLAQTISGNAEMVGQLAVPHVATFAKIGDFAPGSPEAGDPSVVIIEAPSASLDHRADTKGVFEENTPGSPQIVQFSGVSAREIYGLGDTRLGQDSPLIIVIPSSGAENFNALIEENPNDIVVLYSAGNQGQLAPTQSAASVLEPYFGKNYFFALGYDTDISGNIDGLHQDSAKPGAFVDSSIAGPYVSGYGISGFAEGTSFSGPAVAAMLFDLYHALNVSGTWTLVDAMKLLMSTRDLSGSNPSYAPDLTKLLVTDSSGEVYEDANGKVYLLQESALRALLPQQSPAADVFMSSIIFDGEGIDYPSEIANGQAMHTYAPIDDALAGMPDFFIE